MTYGKGRKANSEIADFLRVFYLAGRANSDDWRACRSLLGAHIHLVHWPPCRFHCHARGLCRCRRQRSRRRALPCLREHHVKNLGNPIWLVIPGEYSNRVMYFGIETLCG